MKYHKINNLDDKIEIMYPDGKDGEKYIIHSNFIECPICQNKIKIYLFSAIALINECAHCKIVIDIDNYGNFKKITANIQDYRITWSNDCAVICKISFPNTYPNVLSNYQTKTIKVKTLKHLKNIINTYKVFM